MGGSMNAAGSTCCASARGEVAVMRLVADQMVAAARAGQAAVGGAMGATAGGSKGVSSRSSGGSSGESNSRN
jgi:hypothetical protein